MHKYGFELGRKWRLSVAELESVFGVKGEVINEEIWLVEMDRELSEKDMNRLGGTIKIVRFFNSVSTIDEVEDALFEHLISRENKKVKFALNLYNYKQQFLKIHKNLLKNLKRKVLKVEGEILIGYSLAVQHFRSYSFRDFERPARDAKSGMLPPKLAQIMINLACPGDGECILYDAFCGSGTVLMEGLLMGKKVIGSDISEKAVSDSETNLEWFRSKFEISRSSEVFLKDARDLSAADFSVMPTCIASEVYLGPPQSQFPTDQQIHKNFSEVEEIILGFLKAAKGFLEKGSAVVLAVPFYRGRHGNFHINDLVENVENLGYEIDKLYKSIKRGSVLYDRKDQIVGREIFRLKLVEK
jgi:tRNA G10  N-methylase Trm11